MSTKTGEHQCNTVVAFQQFDKTGSEFLQNHVGEELVKVLPTLRFRQAIAAGKGFRSRIPMIFEVPEINEPEVSDDARNRAEQKTE